MIQLRCQFCGVIHDFSKEDLYDTLEDGKEVFREKFCTKCGEPLTLTCPNCNRGHRLDINFDKNNFFQILDTFWDPDESPLDKIIPALKAAFSVYLKRADDVTPSKFRDSQKDFLIHIPNLREDLEKIIELLNEIKKLRSIANLWESEYKKLAKGIDKSLNECKEIQNSILPESHHVNDKKEKQLKKQVPFLEIEKDFSRFLVDIQKIRDIEIKQQQDALKPGYEKIKTYLKQDPEFYRSICPVCNAKIFNINRQLYLLSLNDNQLQFVKNLPKYYIEKKSMDTGSKTVRFDILIHIEKGKVYDFHGQIALLLTDDDDPQPVGRNIIRDEADYDENEAQDILFDEDDPLARISRAQFTLEKNGNEVKLLAQEYNENRPGTYLNSMEYDIRKKDESGLILQSGNKIIIPLTKEINNPNRIEMHYK
jgi:hypothetical protein